jgi:trimethylamine--corrinoid protein Co-methyltransferase
MEPTLEPLAEASIEAPVVEKPGRRSGGRAGRVAVRTAPLAANLRPVRPGMSGGQYSALSDANVLRIHEAALDALETIGLSQAPPSGIEIMTGAGAVLGDDGRLRFPRALVEDMLALAKKDVVLHGRDPAYDLDLSGTRVHYGTAGAAVHVVDVETRTYRESTAKDLFDASRITHALDNVHFFQRAMVCRDVVDNFEMDINTLYACCGGTTKHVGTSFSDPSHIAGCMDFLHTVAGAEEAWRAAICLQFQLLRRAADEVRRGKLHHHGELHPCGHAGAAVVSRAGRCDRAGTTGDGHRAGSRRVPGGRGLCQRHGAGPSGGVRHLAICLRSAHRRNVGRFGRTGAADGGLRADAPVLRPAGRRGCGHCRFQAARHAGRLGAGNLQHVMAGLSGLNMVYESVGMHASLLGFCMESLVLGDDMLGQVLRCVRGIDVTEDSVSLDAMREVCLEGRAIISDIPRL